MADEGGGKAAFRVAKKGEGKCQRSAGTAFDQLHARCARPPARVSTFSYAKLVHLVMKKIAAVLLGEC
jgi:rubredoxin